MNEITVAYGQSQLSLADSSIHFSLHCSIDTEEILRTLPPDVSGSQPIYR